MLLACVVALFGCLRVREGGGGEDDLLLKESGPQLNSAPEMVRNKLAHMSVQCCTGISSLLDKYLHS